MASRAVRSPATRTRSRIATVLLPLLALLAGAGIAAALLQALADPQPASTASAAEQGTGRIVLDADDYIGKPVDEVTERLTALGLDVELREEVTEDTVPDRVIGVKPTGTSLERGDRVIVTYAVAPAETGSSTGGSGVTGAAVGGEAVPTEGAAPEGGDPTDAAGTEAPATTTMSATATSSAATETSSASETSTSTAPSSDTETATPTTASTSSP